MNDLQKIAVVIDADNTQLSKIGDVLREVSTYGRIVVKRAYGNWKKQELKNWESEIKRLAIKAVQQFDYVSGKNASDIALVIDTVDLLHKNIYDAFVIVSSDSDYTPLAIRLHESGVYVIGVGEKKTPISFKNSCDEFLLLENISTVSEKTKDEPTTETSTAVPDIDNEPTPVVSTEDNKAPTVESSHTVPDVEAPGVSTGDNKVPAEETVVDGSDLQEDIDEIHGLLRSAYETYQGDDGFANVSAVGSFIKRAKPDFDCRTYGYSKLPQLLEAFPQKYEVTRYPGKGTVIIVAYKCLPQGN